MSISLTITLVIVALSLLVLTTYFLKKGRITEKHSLLWYGFSLLILLVGIFPNLFSAISNKLGFQVMSNLIIGFMIGILLLLNMALTIMIAGQKKKTTMLIQEISIVKSQINDSKESDKNGRK